MQVQHTASRISSTSRYKSPSVLADVSSVSPLSEQRSKRQPTHSLQRSAYPHQPFVDTLYVLSPRRPKLVLTGTSIPLWLRTRDIPRFFYIYLLIRFSLI